MPIQGGNHDILHDLRIRQRFVLLPIPHHDDRTQTAAHKEIRIPGVKTNSPGSSGMPYECLFRSWRMEQTQLVGSFLC